jgi:hypothetical protein
MFKFIYYIIKKLVEVSCGVTTFVLKGYKFPH